MPRRRPGRCSHKSYSTTPTTCWSPSWAADCGRCADYELAPRRPARPHPVPRCGRGVARVPRRRVGARRLRPRPRRADRAATAGRDAERRARCVPGRAGGRGGDACPVNRAQPRDTGSATKHPTNGRTGPMTNGSPVKEHMKIHKVVAEHAVTAGLLAVAVVEMDDIRRWAYEVRSAGGELVQDEALLKAATLPGVGANLYRSTVAARWEYDCLSLTFRWRDPSGDAAERA